MMDESHAAEGHSHWGTSAEADMSTPGRSDDGPMIQDARSKAGLEPFSGV